MIGRPLRLCWALALFAGAGFAQDPAREPAGAPAGGEGPARLRRLEERLAALREQELELRALVESQDPARPPVDPRWLTVTEVDRARAAGADPAALIDGMRARTEALRAELAALDAQVLAARALARERAAGDSLPRPEEQGRLERPAAPEAAAPARTAAGPATRPSAAGEPLLVRGSEDRLRTGRAALEAGRAALRDARLLDADGRAEAAERRRGDARRWFETAHAELEPQARGHAAAPAALFALARCEEQLGRIAVADALYAAVMERDRITQSGGRVDYGPFGRSARTARAVMHWVDDTADWRPRRDVDQIRWDER
jgi:hypothetical protein